MVEVWRTGAAIQPRSKPGTLAASSKASADPRIIPQNYIPSPASHWSQLELSRANRVNKRQLELGP